MFNKSLVFSILLLPMAFLPAVAEEQTAVITVDGMTCGADPHIIRKVLSELKGVDDVKITLEHNVVVVSFDNQKITVAELLRATGSAGYPARLSP